MLKDLQQISVYRMYADSLSMYAVCTPFELLLEFP